MNENQLTVVKNYEISKPIIHRTDSIVDKCYRDCHNKHFHTSNYRCICYIKFTSIANNGVLISTVSDRNMGLYESNKKLKIAGQRGFICFQINKLTIRIYSHQRLINISCFVKFQIPMCHLV